MSTQQDRVIIHQSRRGQAVQFDDSAVWTVSSGVDEPHQKSPVSKAFLAKCHSLVLDTLRILKIS